MNTSWQSRNAEFQLISRNLERKSKEKVQCTILFKDNTLTISFKLSNTCTSYQIIWKWVPWFKYTDKKKKELKKPCISFSKWLDQLSAVKNPNIRVGVEIIQPNKRKFCSTVYKCKAFWSMNGGWRELEDCIKCSEIKHQQTVQSLDVIQVANSWIFSRNSFFFVDEDARLGSHTRMTWDRCYFQLNKMVRTNRRCSPSDVMPYNILLHCNYFIWHTDTEIFKMGDLLLHCSI